MDLKRFMRYYRPYRGFVIFDMFCAFMMAVLDLILPIFSKSFIDDFIPNRKLDMIILFTVILFGIYILRLIMAYILGYWGHVLGTRIEKDVRSDLFRKIQSLPFKYFDENKTGQILSRFTNDLKEIGEMSHHAPEDLFIALLMIGGSLTFLVMINPILTFILFGVIIVLVVFVLSQRKKASTHAFRAVKKSHGEINSRLETSISGIRLCKTFTNEGYEIELFEERNKAYASSWNLAYRKLAKMTSGNSFLMDILSVLAIGIGGILVVNQQMSLGSLVSFLLYSTMFVTPVRRLVQFTHQYLDGATGFDRFSEIMKIEPEIFDTPAAVELKNPRGKIEFRTVSFQYESNLPTIFTDFNLIIEPGQIIGLVGPSGVGKTTLTHLIPRFYEVSKGEVCIDGININKFTQKSLRQSVGFVQQDVIVFWGTFRENIIYGKPTATDEEIIAAAKKAKIHDFIVSLPQGYNTLVGERGVKLSGGEKQRLAIARIFLKNPPILILDEATSSLDNVTEVAVQESLMELAKGRTTIIIAHRLSTLKHAKEILLLMPEGVKERGTHEELMRLNGIYAHLYNVQYMGFMNS